MFKGQFEPGGWGGGGVEGEGFLLEFKDFNDSVFRLIVCGWFYFLKEDKNSCVNKSVLTPPSTSRAPSCFGFSVDLHVQQQLSWNLWDASWSSNSVLEESWEVLGGVRAYIYSNI